MSILYVLFVIALNVTIDKITILKNLNKDVKLYTFDRYLWTVIGNVL